MLTDQEKKIIGVICGLNRKEEAKKKNKRDGKWSVNNFLKAKDGGPICSPRTYDRIVRGDIIPDDEIYRQVLYKSNLNMDWKDKWANELQEYSKEILRLVWTYNFEELDICIDNALAFLKDAENEFYYSDYYQLFLAIKNDYIYTTNINIDFFERFVAIYKIFDEYAQIVILDILFNFAVYRQMKYSLVNRLNFMIDISLDHPLFKFNQCLLFQYTNNIVSTYNGLNNLIDILDIRENPSRYLEIRCFQLNLTDSLQQSETLQLEAEIIASLSEYATVIPKRIASNFFYMMGMRKFNRREYEVALKLFLKSITYGQKRRLIQINIFLYYIINQLQNDKIYYQFNYDLEYSLRETMGVFYHYFILKNGQKKGEKYTMLEKYIMDEVLPKLTKEYHFYYPIFEAELSSIALETRSYKKVMIYREKLAKISQRID